MENPGISRKREARLGRVHTYVIPTWFGSPLNFGHHGGLEKGIARLFSCYQRSLRLETSRMYTLRHVINPQLHAQ